jgi:hypothetical protein
MGKVATSHVPAERTAEEIRDEHRRGSASVNREAGQCAPGAPCHQVLKLLIYAAWVRRKMDQPWSDFRIWMKICSNCAVHLAVYDGCRDFRFRQAGAPKGGLVRGKFSNPHLPGSYCQLTGSHVPPHRLCMANYRAFRHNWAAGMRQYALLYDAYVVVRGEWAKMDDLTSAGTRAARGRTKARWTGCSHVRHIQRAAVGRTGPATGAGSKFTIAA